MKTSSRFLRIALGTLALSTLLVGCSKDPGSQESKAPVLNKKAPFTVGENPPGFDKQSIGQTQLVPFASPDKAFTMLLPSAARCTESSNEQTLFILCVAASQDVGVMMYYSLQPELSTMSLSSKMAVLQASAQRKIQGDMDASKIPSSVPIETQEIFKNNVPGVKATVLVGGQQALQSMSFIKAPFLIHINAFPNPKSPNAASFVKQIIDSIEPTAGDHPFATDGTALPPKDAPTSENSSTSPPPSEPIQK